MARETKTAMTPQKFIICLLVLLTQSFAGPANAEVYGSGWYREVQASVAHESNLSRGYGPYQKITDTVTSLTIGAGYAGMASDHLRYTLSGYAGYSRHEAVGGLSRTSLAFAGSMIFQPNLRYENLWYSTAINLRRLNYRDSAARDGYQADGVLSVHRRLGMGAVGRLGYRYIKHLAADRSTAQALDRAVFDVARQQLFIGVDYTLADAVYLVAEYAYSRGDLTHSAPGPNDPDFAYSVRTSDPVFDRCNLATCPQWWAYRSAARVQSLDLGLVTSLAGINYDLSARYAAVRGNGGGQYANWSLQLGAVWDF